MRKNGILLGGNADISWRPSVAKLHKPNADQ